MKASDIGTQVLIAGATAAVATTIGVLITNWLTKKATTEDIASGKQPLPPGSTPTTNGPPVTAVPISQPQSIPTIPPQPQPQPRSDLSSAAAIAQGISLVQGYMGPSWSNAPQS